MNPTTTKTTALQSFASAVLHSQQQEPILTSESTPLQTALSTMGEKNGELFVLTSLRKNLGNIHALEKMGMKVTLKVYRLTKEDGEALMDSQGLLPTRELNEKASELAQPAYQLRVQREHTAEAFASGFATPTAQASAFERIMRANYLAPKGGYVRVEIVSPLNGKTYAGEHHFKHNAIFCKKKASLAAFGKTYSRMLADSSMGRVRGKRVINELVK